MRIEEFLQQYGSRLRAYAVRTARRYRLPEDMAADLEQACVLAAMRELKYWKADLGGAKPKSAFNWCAGPMRREMVRTVRSHLGYKPNSRAPIERLCVPFDEEAGDGVGTSAADIQTRAADFAELHRLLATVPRSPHLVRFLAVALSPASGADLARAQGVSRQAICTSVSRTRRQLKAALG